MDSGVQSLVLEPLGRQELFVALWSHGKATQAPPVDPVVFLRKIVLGVS
jgi:hypothetical protein